ncbi:MAG: phenylacetic acid degradation operon negative regulatory protein PaaX [Candidatus Eremiobacteraeota bacterium]|nr:phenylacetic acid degradation operon negative regulatory protein PaaX [Candidatus Eremiobacteraeota bacterium]
MTVLRPRSMLFTLYGDYVFPGGHELWLGSLVRIADRLGISEVAVRSAVARLAREGWILPRRAGNRSYYALSPAGRELIAEGTRRIYRTNGKRWDGGWCLLTYSIPESERGTRDRLRKRLAWLGFGALAGGIYVAPRDVSDDVHQLLRTHGAASFARVFRAQLSSGDNDASIVRQCWDVPRIARAYERFIRHYQPLYAADARRGARKRLDDGDAFARRFALTHDFRRFPFIDPDLPGELLPANWAGARARELFERYHALLTEGALRFFSSSLAAGSSG